MPVSRLKYGSPSIKEWIVFHSMFSLISHLSPKWSFRNISEPCWFINENLKEDDFYQPGTYFAYSLSRPSKKFLDGETVRTGWKEGRMEMPIEVASAIRLESAFFCLSCELVANCSDFCPGCGQGQLWPLESWLGRVYTPEDSQHEKSNLQEVWPATTGKISQGRRLHWVPLLGR